ncbi:hypothetical protein [Rathayibacter toxicus]|uniref:hypothetical protein n=1 Tax=Rathayibacter toxicus TaxID=145458 RepID=UPI001C046A96|nr:hypothetical protein [Rathayibacter toxicus]QWL29655.1 hypothetical protein E2R34_02040 [Rathayibacter toxicus]
MRWGFLREGGVRRDEAFAWVSVYARDVELVVSAGTWCERVTSPAFPTQVVAMGFELSESISREAQRCASTRGQRFAMLWWTHARPYR